MPVVTASDFTAPHNQNIAASNLFSVTMRTAIASPISVMDSTGDPASGHWIVNGVVQGSNVASTSPPAQLASTTFQSGSGSEICGSVPTTEQRGVRGRSFNVTRRSIMRQLQRPPISSPHTIRISRPAHFFSATDADGDTITNYQFWDSTADPASGHWVVGGVTQGTNVAIDVTAAQLAQRHLPERVRPRMICMSRANDA